MRRMWAPEMALADEVDQRRLGDRGGVGVDQRADREERVDQLLAAPPCSRPAGPGNITLLIVPT